MFYPAHSGKVFYFSLFLRILDEVILILLALVESQESLVNVKKEPLSEIPSMLNLYGDEQCSCTFSIYVHKMTLV